jgi:hypothetical protein
MIVLWINNEPQCGKYLDMQANKRKNIFLNVSESYSKITHHIHSDSTENAFSQLEKVGKRHIKYFSKAFQWVLTNLTRVLFYKWFIEAKKIVTILKLILLIKFSL